MRICRRFNVGDGGYFLGVWGDSVVGKRVAKQLDAGFVEFAFLVQSFTVIRIGIENKSTLTQARRGPLLWVTEAIFNNLILVANVIVLRCTKMRVGQRSHIN